MRIHPSLTLAAVAATLSLTACAGDSTGPASGASRPLSLSFSTAAATAASGSLAVSPSLAATSGADALVVTSVQIVLARVELQRVGATCASTEAAGDDRAGDDDKSCAELELAPGVVDVPVDGTTAKALTVAVPAGTYSAFEAKIRPVETNGRRGAGSAAFLTAHPDLAGVSVRVQGTYNGKAFTYAGAPEAGIESAFSPPLVVDAAGAAGAQNVTVHVSLENWFRTASGVLVDPGTANAGGPNAGLVRENIRRSFKAFRDDDRNGRDDGDDRRGGR